jgi:hypothetical protein
MSYDNIKILAQPLLPYTLHGVNPRTIMGQTSWNKIKKVKQKEADHHCQICDRYVAHVIGDYLECHEVYEIDEEKYEFKLIDIVAICNTCHSFIHFGRTTILYNEGKITEDRYYEIYDKGQQLLQSQNLVKKEIDLSAPYVLVWNNKYYWAGE